MADFPNVWPLMDPRDQPVVSPTSRFSLGYGFSGQTAPAGQAWPAANDAIFVPFRLPFAATVYRMACGTGTGTTGNFDLGIYDRGGAKMVSTGSTAKTTGSSDRIIDVADTLLPPGMYYLAMATDGTTNYQGWVSTNAVVFQFAGIRKMASAFALPATATYATITASYIPAVAAYLYN